MRRIVLYTVIMVFSLNAETLLSEKEVKAVRLIEPIVVDGRLNEAVYHHQAVHQFMQREPNQGETPSERTEVWIHYDETALYISARCYDSFPDSIISVLARRDQLVTADWFGVFLDPYHDKRSGNYFVLGPSGTKADGVLYNDDWDDSDWDGVWDGETIIDEHGWSLEMRIPFSQLRYHESDKQIWGINFRRDIGRKNEQDYLVYTPRMESGFVSRFAELNGIEQIPPSQQLEILPFVTTKAEYTHPEAGDPFNSGSRYSPELGVDLRYGLSSNLILNATVNPDFGQVEVDPAVVNLSDVESYFQEKRPFFVEGANIFTNFGRGGGRNYWNANFSNPTLFYSRRIGRTPQGSVGSADFVDMPIASRILGAGKITGKIGSDWNVGTIHAVTQREFADISLNGSRLQTEVEPATYFGVMRVQKEFDGGSQGIGILSTLTARQFQDDRLRSDLGSSGKFIGVDGWTFLDEQKNWVVTGWGGMSRVDGSPERMVQLQRNSTHYFQRPDISHVRVDSQATSLTGFSGRVYLMKQQGNFYFNTAVGAVDPNFEINDLGFLGRTDLINGHAGAGYNWTEPDGIFRRKEFGGLLFSTIDYSGNNIGRGFFHWGYVQLMNFYSLNWGFGAGGRYYNQRRTRGGPLTINTPYLEYNMSINSDDSKSIAVSLFGSGNQSSQNNSSYVEISFSFRPAQNVAFSFSPYLNTYMNGLQYVSTISDSYAQQTFGKRYVFGRLDQTTIGAGVRLNWTFSPSLSLQVYAQPLISTGKYSEFKELVRSKSDEYLAYGDNGSTISTGNGEYSVDPDGAGNAPQFSISDPNFSSKYLRGNAVIRWEYTSGSVLYFVWTQSRSDYENNGEFQFNKSFERLVNAQSDNIFLIKMSYYFTK